MNKVVYLDVDDTVANTRVAMIAYYRLHTRDFSTMPWSDNSMKYDKLCPLWSRQRISDSFIDPAFFTLLRPMPGAKEGIEYLIEKGYDVQFCTAHREEGKGYKLNWLRHYFPMIKTIHFTEVFVPKDDYVGYAFIDDHIHNLENNKSEIRVMFDTYDILDCHDKEIVKISKWKAIREVL